MTKMFLLLFQIKVLTAFKVALFSLVSTLQFEALWFSLFFYNHKTFIQ